jgi:hypothetical protein
MTNRLARFRKVAALAHDPAPVHRLVAALVSGAFAFLLTQLLLGVLWGAGASAVLFSSIALAVAAATAAITAKPVRAVVYGCLGAIWLLFEGLVLVLGSIVAGLG